jgi:hypothetical protein
VIIRERDGARGPLPLIVNPNVDPELRPLLEGPASSRKSGGVPVPLVLKRGALNDRFGIVSAPTDLSPKRPGVMA